MLTFFNGRALRMVGLAEPFFLLEDFFANLVLLSTGVSSSLVGIVCEGITLFEKFQSEDENVSKIEKIYYPFFFLFFEFT